MTDKIYERVVEKWEQVTELPPQTIGPLTPVYKSFVRRFKTTPLPLLIVLSTLAVVSLYWLFGGSVAHLVSLLQRGF